MFEYEIIKKIGVAGENHNDTKEINIIKWSDNAPCIDVRRWRNGKPLKGIAFYPDEIDELIKLLKKAKRRSYKWQENQTLLCHLSPLMQSFQRRRKETMHA